MNHQNALWINNQGAEAASATVLTGTKKSSFSSMSRSGVSPVASHQMFPAESGRNKADTYGEQDGNVRRRIHNLSPQCTCCILAHNTASLRNAAKTTPKRIAKNHHVTASKFHVIAPLWFNSARTKRHAAVFGGVHPGVFGGRQRTQKIEIDFTGDES